MLDTLVVTATRVAGDPLDVPAAIDRIDREDILRAQLRVNVSESLRRVPGVLARDRQNHAQDLQISIRGFGARATFGVRGVRLFADGIPATMPDGQGQVSHFVLDAADRIEVLRGPFSALYGNSSGGVIQIFSAEAPSRMEFRTGGAFADGVLRGSFGWHGPWPGTRRGGYAFDVMSFDTDGVRDHSSARRHSAQGTIKSDFGKDGTWVATLNALDAEADDPQGLNAAELEADPHLASPGARMFDTRKSTRQHQVGVRAEHGLGGAGRLTLRGHVGKRMIVQFLAVPLAAQENPLSGGGVVDLDRDYFGGDARWRWQGGLLSKPLALSLGIEHQVSDEHRRGFENFSEMQLGVRGTLRRDEDNRVTSIDEYLQLEWEPAVQWRAHAGLRHSEIRFRSRDHYVTDENPSDSGRMAFRKATPVAGILWKATPRLSVFANAGIGFETPTFNELAYRSDGTSGLNTKLRPASSENFEIGLRGRRDGTGFALVYFESRTDDELVVASNEGGRSTFTNAVLSRRRGGELSWSVEWSPRWKSELAYTFLDARYRRAFPAAFETMVPAGNRIPGVPSHHAWGEMRWLPGFGLDLALAASVFDRVFANDANSASAPGFVLVDVSAERAWDVGGIELGGFLRCNNLIDRQAVGSVIVNESNGRYFEPAPGREWLAGIQARFIVSNAPQAEEQR